METSRVTEWRKSTYSGGNGGECVEVANVWRKSTYSGGNGGSCVEVANAARAAVAVRDTTDRDGTTLTIPAPAWRNFTSTLK